MSRKSLKEDRLKAQARWHAVGTAFPYVMIAITLVLAILYYPKAAEQTAVHKQFKELSRLQKQTNDPELAEVASFMAEHQDIVKLVPVRRNAEGGISFEYFDPKTRVLALPSDIKLTPTWQALLLAHGARHAYTFMVKHPEWDSHDLKTTCYDERDTHAFNHRLLRELKGKAYEELIGSEVIRLRKEVPNLGVPLGAGFPGLGPYNPRLDELFGPAASHEERRLRQGMVWMDATFRLIEQDEKNDVENKKALFIRTAYQK